MAAGTWRIDDGGLEFEGVALFAVVGVVVEKIMIDVGDSQVAGNGLLDAVQLARGYDSTEAVGGKDKLLDVLDGAFGVLLACVFGGEDGIAIGVEDGQYALMLKHFLAAKDVVIVGQTEFSTTVFGKLYEAGEIVELVLDERCIDRALGNLCQLVGNEKVAIAVGSFGEDFVLCEQVDEMAEMADILRSAVPLCRPRPVCRGDIPARRKGTGRDGVDSRFSTTRA